MQVPVLIGGDERDRTDDLCVANASLSQLSYTPKLYVAKNLPSINAAQRAILYTVNPSSFQRENYQCLGRMTLNSTPRPGVLVIWILPPWLVMIRLAIGSPNPVPLSLVV